MQQKCLVNEMGYIEIIILYAINCTKIETAHIKIGHHTYQAVKDESMLNGKKYSKQHFVIPITQYIFAVLLWEQSISPEECILYISSWINIICKIRWHLELSMSCSDENIDMESKLNPKFICQSFAQVHVRFPLSDFGSTLGSASIFSSPDTIDNSKCHIISHMIFIQLKIHNMYDTILFIIPWKQGEIVTLDWLL